MDFVQHKQKVIKSTEIKYVLIHFTDAKTKTKTFTFVCLSLTFWIQTHQNNMKEGEPAECNEEKLDVYLVSF